VIVESEFFLNFLQLAYFLQLSFVYPVLDSYVGRTA